MSINNEQITPLLEVRRLKKYFPSKDDKLIVKKRREKGQVKAVNDLSFKLYKGETYGLVGESGCGKSTTGRTILRLEEPTAGSLMYKGQDVLKISRREFQPIRREFQMVFQDPYSSLNPRYRIGHILEEVLAIHSIGGSRKERTEKVMDILDEVGMQMDHYYRYPHELSGGQRQRVGLARALLVNPKLVICDEPVSALDVSVQSQIINLFKKLQDELSLTYLFISHDLSVVRHISDRIGIMYLGKLVEEAPTDKIFEDPLHPYTRALLSAVPIAKPNIKRERVILKGELPSPLNPPNGCVFHTRCPYVMDVCKTMEPNNKEMTNGHIVACHLHA